MAPFIKKINGMIRVIEGRIPKLAAIQTTQKIIEPYLFFFRVVEIIGIVYRKLIPTTLNILPQKLDLYW